MMMEKGRIKSSVLSWVKACSKGQGWNVTWEEETRRWEVVMELLELMKHASDGKFGINTRNSDIVKYKANARWDQ